MAIAASSALGGPPGSWTSLRSVPRRSAPLHTPPAANRWVSSRALRQEEEEVVAGGPASSRHVLLLPAWHVNTHSYSNRYAPSAARFVFLEFEYCCVLSLPERSPI